jgi:hypothetical protein
LNLRPDTAAYYLPASNVTFKFFNSFWRTGKNSSSALAALPFRVNGLAVSYAKSTSELVSSMVNVEELNVKELESPWVDGPFGTRSKWRGGRDLKDLEYIMQTVINTGWATFGSTLRRLKLHFPHYCYPDSVSSSTMPSTLEFMFPHLEELDIASYTFKFLCDQVVPFINNHHSTLKILTLRFKQVAPMRGSVETCSCLPAIRTIPNLKKFDFYHSIEQEMLDGNSGVHTVLRTGLQFHLQLHSDYEHIRLKLIDTWKSSSKVTVPPCLKSLGKPAYCTINMKNVATNLQLHMCSLSVLKWERVCLLLQEVKTFIEQDPAHRNPKYWIHWR